MKILHLISSPRGEASLSIKLGKAVLEKLQSANPRSTVKIHDLTKTPFPHLEEVHLNSFFTPKENLSPELTEAIKHSDEAIAELMDTDVLIIDVPMYNFGIPSTLKTWIDHTARAGKTFQYSGSGPEGLVKNKKVYLAISTGAVYSEGPMKPYDFTEPYLRTILGFLGMTDMTAFRVEGTSLPDLKEQALEKAVQGIQL